LKPGYYTGEVLPPFTTMTHKEAFKFIDEILYNEGHIEPTLGCIEE
jgi:hypothetical protein